MSKSHYNIDGELYVRADLVREDQTSVEAFAARVVKEVAEVTSFWPAAITGVGREPSLIKARAACICLMYERCMSWVSIGKALDRNHSTVISCFKRHGDHKETKRIVRAARKRLDKEEA